MRFGLIFLALVAAVTASPAYQRAADQDLLKKQQDTIYLLEHVIQELPNQELYNLGYNYDIETNYHQYYEPTTVQYYVGMVKSGLVQPKGTAYSSSVGQLRKEVALLARVFLAAKDYPVFLKTAAWARIHVNEGQFVKAYVSAILQRQDTAGVIPPPLYEILPQNYIDARIIQEAGYINAEGSKLDENVLIPVNYTDHLPIGESQLSYFTHDIGLNAYHAYISLAGYMTPEQQQQQQQTVHHQGQVYGSGYEKGNLNGHGSHYYYLYQQFLARYNLNRLTGGLGPIPNVDYENVDTPYEPHLHHINGLEYPGRSGKLALHHQDLINYVHILEKRLMDAIDSGYVITPQKQFLSLYQPQGLNILGDLIEGTGHSVNPRYYGSLQAAARKLLGNAPEFLSIWDYTPSALETSEAAVRDPAFYQLYQRVTNLFQHYQQSLPAYQYNDLVLPGVKIQKIVFPNLVTYLDKFNVDLGNGYVHSVKEQQQQQQQQHQNVGIKAQVTRLNHQPYEYSIVVTSEMPQTNAVVRVYLGPKYDHAGKPVNIIHHRLQFVELDQFVHDLKEGENVIVRHSQQAPMVSQDLPSVHQIKVQVESAVRSQNPYYIAEPQHIYGFPARLALPKGTAAGAPLQVLVIISANEEANVSYGPVVPASLQTYQSHQYQIVAGEQYNGQTNQQEGVLVPQTIEVLPQYQATGVYGNQIGKLWAYYGNYLYAKYPQYPVNEIHGLGYQHQQHYGNQHTGIYQQYQYQHQYPHQYQQHQQQQQQQQAGYAGQQGIVGEQGYHHQGHLHQGQSYQGMMGQGQMGQGQIPQEQMNHGQIYGQNQQYQQYQQGQQIETGKGHGIYQGQGVGLGGMVGGYPVSGIVGAQNVVGGQIHGVGQNVQQQQSHVGQQVTSEYLKNYYNNKHIGQIIGGALSLDNKPLGYPLERPLAPSVLYVPNIGITDVIVHHVDHPIGGAY